MLPAFSFCQNEAGGGAVHRAAPFRECSKSLLNGYGSGYIIKISSQEMLLWRPRVWKNLSLSTTLRLRISIPTFFVGESGVLVHNTCYRDKLKAAIWRMGGFLYP